jgi:aspartyl-tRNA(Asn)/glutamyl-tRNA(Gln) amidotransferase subunit A
VGKLWSEADLLAFAYSYETATRHRKSPVLSAS